MQIEREIENEDVEACYREIRQLSKKTRTLTTARFTRREVTPGGYTWIFPKGGAKLTLA